MSISLTWANFALIVSVSLLVYYTLIVLLFYRHAFRSLFTKEVDKLPSEANHSAQFSPGANAVLQPSLFGDDNSANDNFIDDEPTHSIGAQVFADELGAYTSSIRETISKEEVIRQLQRIVRKYPSIMQGDSRYELTQLIALSTENNASLHLTADELSQIWNESDEKDNPA